METLLTPPMHIAKNVKLSWDFLWFKLLPRMNARGEFASAVVALGFAFSLCAAHLESSAIGATGKASMQVTSTAFSEGQPMPEKYTCDAKNVSPPLQWSGAPEATKSLVLIADDPDAPVGTWVHWVVYDIPAAVTGLPEDLPKGQYTPQGAKQGLNDFKHLGYGGPCPPGGKAHRYFFKVYALDTVLTLPAGSRKQDVERAMEKHVVAEGHLMGTYKRK